LATRPLSLSPGAVVLAVALPLIFLHRNHQPSLSVGVGTADLDIALADLAVLLVAAISLFALIRGGLQRLPPGRWAWLAVCAFLAWIFVSALAHAGTEGYPFADHFVTALKFAEYAVLAVAVPLLAPTARELLLLLGVLVAWAAFAAAVGVAQFAGLDVLDAWSPGRRQPAFLGHHDLAALAGVALSAAVAGILLGRWWPHPFRLAVAALVGGAVAMVVSGSLVGALGFVAGAALGALAARRRIDLDRGRLLRLASLAAVVLFSTALLRGGDIGQFGRFLGLLEKSDSTREDVQTYSQRSVLAYIGIRIFLDHPVAGLGWQASADERGYVPYLDDARRRFPDVTDEAFPSPAHPWGVQNAYVQALADLGVIGLALFLSVLVTGALLAWRAVAVAPPDFVGPALVSLVLLVTVAGVWAAQGLFAGLPLDATTWLGVGIAATAAGAVTREQPAG
jgi:hypothetical protein